MRTEKNVEKLVDAIIDAMDMDALTQYVFEHEYDYYLRKATDEDFQNKCKFYDIEGV